jgi:hypothetical protein
VKSLDRAGVIGLLASTTLLLFGAPAAAEAETPSQATAEPTEPVRSFLNDVDMSLEDIRLQIKSPVSPERARNLDPLTGLELGLEHAYSDVGRTFKMPFRHHRYVRF